MNTLNNNVQLIGYLGAHPEMKSFAEGKTLSLLSLATKESYFSQGKWRQDTQWHRIVAWNKMSERVQQHLQKGSHVLVEGRLVHRCYETAQGETRKLTQVHLLSQALKSEFTIFWH